MMPIDTAASTAGIAYFSQFIRRGSVIVLARDVTASATVSNCDRAPVCACGITAEYLCDYPIGGGKTCDLNLCDRCKRSIGEDRDLCLVHHAQVMGIPKVNPWPPKRGDR